MAIGFAPPMLYHAGMIPQNMTAAAGRAFLHVPEELVAPETDVLVQDARAMLLHNLTLYGEVRESGILVSPIWENNEGVVSLRAALVPKEIAARYYQGPGLASLREASVLEMVADVIPMLLEEPASAARALAATHQLWISADAPIRGLQIPYKGHFKILTLLLADLARKITAGFDEIEWLASIGVLGAFHDPSQDRPVEEIQRSTRERSIKMCAEEEEWMREMLSKR